MPRDLERKQPWTKLRLWTAGEPIAGVEAEDPGQMGIELGGSSEPPNYAMVGGFLNSAQPSDAFSPDLDHDLPYFDNVFGHDDVHWHERLRLELPLEYRQSIAVVAPSLRVTRAAHGEVSSSEAAFQWLARVLAAGLALGEWPDDNAVWQMVDEARRLPYVSS